VVKTKNRSRVYPYLWVEVNEKGSPSTVFD